MSLLKAIPVLPCTNIIKTVDFYSGKLGFTSKFAGNFMLFKKGQAEIYFYLVKDALHFQPASCFIVTDNAQDLYTKCIANDLVYPNGQMSDLRYGRKEFSIVDNNGNTIHFGEQK